MMRRPSQLFAARFKLVSGALLGVTFAGQVALASSGELAVTQTTLDAVSAATAAPAQAVPAKPAKPAKPAMTGPQVYNAVCVACHSPPGLGGAPALGDNAAWAARMDRGGMETLVHNALQGYSGSTGIMPRKGGRVDLSDAEIASAVEYMIEKSAP